MIMLMVRAPAVCDPRLCANSHTCKISNTMHYQVTGCRSFPQLIWRDGVRERCKAECVFFAFQYLKIACASEYVIEMPS